MLLYYITDRSQFAGDEAARRSRLLETITQAARCGVDYIQLREKDISARELETLAREAHLRTENQKLKTVFLINSRADIALACGAKGVHLPANDISPSEVRKIWGQFNPAQLTIGASCHTRTEVARAQQEGADFAVFGPVFEKARSPRRGARCLAGSLPGKNSGTRSGRGDVGKRGILPAGRRGRNRGDPALSRQ